MNAVVEVETLFGISVFQLLLFIIIIIMYLYSAQYLQLTSN